MPESIVLFPPGHAAAGAHAMPRPSNTAVEILLVEDSPDDADLMTTALREGGLSSTITLLMDGEAAVSYLRREGAYYRAPRPDLILLDLHLPRMNGLEVLAEIKNDPELRRIPVVVMTSSDREQAFVDAYNLHANCCVSKPVGQDDYALTVKKIERFWLHVAQRPQ
jgi:chemotaxis family two-component system response regulator Rcp1